MIDNLTKNLYYIIIMTTQTLTESKFNKLLNNYFSNVPKIGDVVKARVIDASKNEILFDIEGFMTGVVRGREVKTLPTEFQKLKTGDEVEALVLDIENEKGQLELSLKAAFVEHAWNFIKNTEQNQEIIDIRVNGANKGGLLSIICNMPAFLPVSQLIPEHYPRVEGGDKKKILKKLRTFIGKTLSVKILSYDVNEQKIIISEKRAWEELQKKKLEHYKPGDIVDVTVKTVTNFGIFVGFDDNLEGLIHISEIPQGEVKQPLSEIIKTLAPDENTVLKAKVISVKGSKVFLSLKM